MGDNFEVDVKGDLIVVWDPATLLRDLRKALGSAPANPQAPETRPRSINCSLEHGKRRTTVAI